MKTIQHLLVFIVLIGLVLLVRAVEPPGGSGSESKRKPCFACAGQGVAKCDKAGCKAGQARCPAPCLKPDDGTWIPLKVDGHPPTDRWKKFVRPDGSYAAWSQAHAGEVVQYQNGNFVNTGPCKACGGTMRIQCANCKGTGQAKCSICDGQKEVPEAWSTFDHPRMKNRPSLFTLKDGRTFVGKRAPIVMGANLTILTATGEVKFATSELLSEQKQPTKP